MNVIADITSEFNVPEHDDAETVRNFDRSEVRAMLSEAESQPELRGYLQAVLRHSLRRQLGMSNAELYDECYSAFFEAEPLEKEALREFMSLFASTYRELLRGVAIANMRSGDVRGADTALRKPDPPTSVADRSEGPKAADPPQTAELRHIETKVEKEKPFTMPTTMEFARKWPELTLQRLDRHDEYSKEHLLNAEVYEQMDLMGCTELEVAQLLDVPLEKMPSRFSAAVAFIRRQELPQTQS